MDIFKKSISKTKKKIYPKMDVLTIMIYLKNDIAKKKYIQTKDIPKNDIFQKKIYPKMIYSKKRYSQKKIY